MVNPPQPRQIPTRPKSPHIPSSSTVSSTTSTSSSTSTGTSTTANNNTSLPRSPHHQPVTGSTAASTSTPSSPSATFIHHHPSRKPSIVEILSSPPPLPNDPNDSIHNFSLSRHASLSSNKSLSQTISNTSMNPTTIGLDWSEIPLTELTESSKLISIHRLHSVQHAFETLLNNNLTSVPVSISKKNPDDLTNCLTFDYSDLNTYLLLIMNKININELNLDDIEVPNKPNPTLKEKYDLVIQSISKAKKGEEVPVDFIIKLHPKNPFIKFNESDTLFSVMETLGNGVHRIAITNEQGSKITGILSQRRLIKYMWENARRFPSLDFYLTSTLQDLKIGSTNPITIYEDQLLIDALHKMFNERVSSLAVIDRSRTLIGNISIVDVKNVTSSQKSHLLFKSVLNFISYNLSQKGIEEGQDQFPIFHVNNQTSLGRVIAKLVATKSHRLWIVDSNRQPSNSISGSSTNSNVTVGYPAPADSSITDKAEEVENSLNITAESQPVPPSPCAVAAAAAASTAAAPPLGAEYTSGTGKLVGVVTLTDILGLFATSKGRRTDPQAARNQRRRSSTSTTRSSVDSALNAEDAIPGNNNTSRRESVDASSDVFRKSFTKPQENVFSKE
ncbi:SDS24 Protein SDS23 [Candida maltosa Xu316]